MGTNSGLALKEGRTVSNLILTGDKTLKKKKPLANSKRKKPSPISKKSIVTTQLQSLGLPEDEGIAWRSVEGIASGALKFWNEFLNLRSGDKNERVLDTVEISRLLIVIRAISWVESRHGTGKGDSAKVDPMQCGNPLDPWWDELIGNRPNDKQDRFIRGLSPHYYASELPGAVMAVNTGFPDKAYLSKLANKTLGHSDSNYTAQHSYYWGIPIFIHKTNTSKASGKTYKCYPVDRVSLVNGATAYNGKGDGQYREKIEAAINMIGWPGSAVHLHSDALSMLTPASSQQS